MSSNGSLMVGAAPAASDVDVGAHKLGIDGVRVRRTLRVRLRGGADARGADRREALGGGHGALPTVPRVWKLVPEPADFRTLVGRVVRLRRLPRLGRAARQHLRELSWR